MIRILFLASNPLDTAPLQLDEESRAIDLAIRQTSFRDILEFKQLWAVRVGDLQEILLRHKPHIVHFSGHGSHSSEIILKDDQGNAFPVSENALTQLFSLLKDNIKCVVLNACYSQNQANAIADVVDCVIGMSDAVSDQAAIKFSASFYQAIGYGRDVKTAFELGRLQVDLEHIDDHSAFQLLAKKIDPSKLTFITNDNNYNFLVFGWGKDNTFLREFQTKYRLYGIVVTIVGLISLGVYAFYPRESLDCLTETRKDGHIRVLESHLEGDLIRWWVAQDGSGLQTFTCPVTNCTEQTRSSAKTILESDLVLALTWNKAEHSPKTIWGSTAAGMLVKLSQHNGNWEQETAIPQPSCPSSAILIDGNRLLLGPMDANDAYLYETTDYETTDQKVWHKVGPLEIIDDLRLQVTGMVYSQDSDVLWTGTRVGLYRLGNIGSSYSVKPIWVTTRYFPIESIKIDNKNMIWVGTTTNGLFILNPITNQWIHAANLSSMRVTAIALSNLATIAFVGTDAGLALCTLDLDKERLTVHCSNIESLSINGAIEAINVAPNDIALVGVNRKIKLINLAAFHKE